MPEPGNDRFARYGQNLRFLLEEFPTIHHLVKPGEPLESLDGWTATMGRYDAVRQQGGHPVLVATLYGPSGAGKSTLFRQLTGVEVPIGEVRPVTRSCVAAIPPELNRPESLAAIFPQFHIEPLHELEQLRHPDTGAHHLFVAIGAPQTGQRLPFVLGDVPDFNSIESANWERAERMLRRAEVVLFVTYPEAYADERTVLELARCCQLAGRMAFLINKVGRPGAAREIWESLPRQLASGRHSGTFAERRADGRTLLEFLTQAPAYYWPYAAGGPALENVQPIQEGTAPLRELLGGLEGESIVLAGLLEPVSRLITTCRDTLGKVDSEIAKSGHRLEQVRAPIVAAAERIAGEEFPIGRFFELVADEVMIGQSNWVSWAWRQTTGIISIAYSAGKQLVDQLTGDGIAELRPRCEIEQRLLAAQSEALFDEWRKMFPQESSEGGILSTDSVRKISEAFRNEPLPATALSWEELVRAEARAWAEAHPKLRKALPVLMPILGAGAGVGIALFAVSGGTLAVILAGAGGLAGGGWLGEFITKMSLEKTLKRASDEWTATRRQQLRDHLDQHLFRRVFHPWIDRQEALRHAPVVRCLTACAELDALCREQVDGPK